MGVLEQSLLLLLSRHFSISGSVYRVQSLVSGQVNDVR